MEEVKKGVKKEIPTLVKVIAVLRIIGGIFGILSGVVLFLIKFVSINIFTQFLSYYPKDVSSLLFLFFTGVGILLGICSLFAAIYLYKGRNWARIATIILVFIGAIISIVYFFIFGTAIINLILGIIIPGLIIGYLLFNKEVKEAFS